MHCWKPSINEVLELVLILALMSIFKPTCIFVFIFPWYYIYYILLP